MQFHSCCLFPNVGTRWERLHYLVLGSGSYCPPPPPGGSSIAQPAAPPPLPPLPPAPPLTLPGGTGRAAWFGGVRFGDLGDGAQVGVVHAVSNLPVAVTFPQPFQERDPSSGALLPPPVVILSLAAAGPPSSRFRAPVTPFATSVTATGFTLYTRSAASYGLPVASYSLPPVTVFWLAVPEGEGVLGTGLPYTALRYSVQDSAVLQAPYQVRRDA